MNIFLMNFGIYYINQLGLPGQGTSPPQRKQKYNARALWYPQCYCCATIYL